MKIFATNKVYIKSIFNALILSAFFMFFPNKECKSQIQLNTKAPEINVTTWLTKNNKPLELRGKYLVLEFWATWCAPCLANLPHLNDLQIHFNKDSNLTFLSITNENLSKINSIKDRFNFESTIISDTTGQTLDNFQIKHLPRTFLIDRKGFIKWIGYPENLSKSIIAKFLKNEELNETLADTKTVVEPSSKKNEIFFLRERFTSTFYDTEARSFFEMYVSNDYEASKSVRVEMKNMYNRLELDRKIQDHFSDLLDVPPHNIQVPSDSKNLYISYCFKKDIANSIEESKNELLQRSLQKLKMMIGLKEIIDDIYIISIVDSLKFKENKSISKSSQGNLSISTNNEIISINNRPIYDLFKSLQDILKKDIIFEDAQIFDNYDIVLDTKGMKELKKSLSYYGLSISKENRLIKKAVLEKEN